MTDANISGSLPKGDANGLSAITRDLIDHPHRFRVIMAIVDCKKITTDNDTGEIVPTARIRRVEAVIPGDLPAAEQLMRRSMEQRSGRAVLPLDLEDEMRMAFKQVDPRTGEMTGDE